MAVHIPLSLETQVEAGLLLMPPSNLFSVARDKDVILAPTQDMIMGVNFLTAYNPIHQVINEHYFSNFDDVINACKQFVIHIQTFIWVRITDNEQKYFNFGKGLEFTAKKLITRYIYFTREIKIINFEE